MREMCAVNSARGHSKCKKKGKNVVSANRLGFRSEGEGKIRHVPEEQERVPRDLSVVREGYVGRPDMPQTHG